MHKILTARQQREPSSVHSLVKTGRRGLAHDTSPSPHAVAEKTQQIGEVVYN